jgi:hypothetical protein
MLGRRWNWPRAMQQRDFLRRMPKGLACCKKRKTYQVGLAASGLIADRTSNEVFCAGANRIANAIRLGERNYEVFTILSSFVLNTLPPNSADCGNFSEAGYGSLPVVTNNSSPTNAAQVLQHIGSLTMPTTSPLAKGTGPRRRRKSYSRSSLPRQRRGRPMPLSRDSGGDNSSTRCWKTCTSNTAHTLCLDCGSQANRLNLSCTS